MNNSNKRQAKIIAALRTTGCYIFQNRNEGAAWYVWHRDHFWVRLTATCRDVWKLVQAGKLEWVESYHGFKIKE